MKDIVIKIFIAAVCSSGCFSLLMRACRYGDTEEVKVLLRSKEIRSLLILLCCTLLVNCTPPVIKKVSKGSPEELLQQIEPGKNVDLEERNCSGFTPLMIAVRGGKTLIDFDCQKPDQEMVEKVKILIEAGANIEARGTRMGWSVLNWAICGGNVEVVKLLLEKGADPNGRIWSGKTPLMIAAFYTGRWVKDRKLGKQRPYDIFPIVKLLLAAGADPYAKDNIDESVFFYYQLGTLEKYLNYPYYCRSIISSI